MIEIIIRVLELVAAHLAVGWTYLVVRMSMRFIPSGLIVLNL